MWGLIFISILFGGLVYYLACRLYDAALEDGNGPL